MCILYKCSFCVYINDINVLYGMCCMSYRVWFCVQFWKVCSWTSVLQESGFEEISNQSPKRASVTAAWMQKPSGYWSSESYFWSPILWFLAKDWYEEGDPENFSKTTSEWYLDGKRRPSTRSSQTISHSLTGQWSAQTNAQDHLILLFCTSSD